MRTARLVGLSRDGRSVIVATDDGEQFALAADDRLRATLRGDRPRLGQLEIEMESALSPREIQTRIRAGASLEEVTRAAGVPQERVERFAAPVLAEREHVAGQALASSVRRRGETLGHRSLRVTVTERLLTRGIDADDVTWDSYRLEDGRWTVTADYRAGEAERHAEFLFDLRARFSVAGNDEARRLIGEHSPAHGPQRGEQPAGDDAEPTLDLNDELALIRATQERPGPAPARTTPSESAQSPESAEPGEQEPTVSAESAEPTVSAESAEPTVSAESAEPTVAVRRLQAVADPAPDAEPGPDSQLDTLYRMLGGDGYEEDSPRVYAGLSEVEPEPGPETGAEVPSPSGVSDASAVPETPPTAGWEPAIVVNYPVEPSQHDDTVPASGEPGDLPGTDEPAPPDPTVNLADRTDEAEEFALEHEQPPPPKPTRRRRASVPSWDEIMFGGPKRPT